jgi:hypothetical protein
MCLSRIQKIIQQNKGMCYSFMTNCCDHRPRFSHNGLLLTCCEKKLKFSVLCFQQKYPFTHLWSSVFTAANQNLTGSRLRIVEEA